MKVLVACEFSGIVRDAFIEEGHEATSCDLLPSESNKGPHIQGDVKSVDLSKYDLLIAHPPCQYLCNSGVRWLWDKTVLGGINFVSINQDRWDKMVDAGRFFQYFLHAPVEYIAIENPVPHRHAVNVMGRNYDFTCQPYNFGDPYTKRTCWWTQGLPKLIPTDVIPKEKVIAKCHKEGPSKDRWKNRSRFYPGMAKAMAKQWGKHVEEKLGSVMPKEMAS